MEYDNERYEREYAQRQAQDEADRNARFEQQRRREAEESEDRREQDRRNNELERDMRSGSTPPARSTSVRRTMHHGDTIWSWTWIIMGFILPVSIWQIFESSGARILMFTLNNTFHPGALLITLEVIALSSVILLIYYGHLQWMHRSKRYRYVSFFIQIAIIGLLLQANA